MTTSSQPIKTLFASDIGRKIEEVIKVDQTDAEVLRDEITEYVVTDAIRAHFNSIYEAYSETPNKPHEGIAIWISGFFGSGKSSFAKMVGLTIDNRDVAGEPAASRFAKRVDDQKLKVLLNTINEKIPTHAVIFDVSTDRGIRSGNQTLTEIMYGLFLQSLGYAKDLDLSELEITLEEPGELEGFEAEYRRLFNKEWSSEKGKIAFSLSEASQVLHSLKPETFPSADSWSTAVKNRADVTAGKLAERALDLMQRRRPGETLLFVIDEVGQFVARDVQKMLDLQAIVQNLGRVGRGRMWVAVTSQERLNEVVSGLDDDRIELARLMDRFPLQVHLEPSDISEVTSRRVLTKNAAAQAVLGELYDMNKARLAEHTRVSADINLPELTRQGFVDLYPVLPYQIDLIIQVVSGLRTLGGSGKHVGGANRTIIKLAQQLLIHPEVNLADAPLGALARLDQVYDLVEGNIGSEVRAKISSIPTAVGHPLGQSVAKVICLLQYVKSVHRTPENIAAALHPSVDGDSQIARVKEALTALEAAHLIRLGDDGYRIPSPTEDDWERTRSGASPRPGDVHRIHTEVIAAFWQPTPSFTLLDTKTFKAGLNLHGRQIVEGDLSFHVRLAEDSNEFASLSEEFRGRSQQEERSVFWILPLNPAIDHETVELYRSREVIARKEREARGEESNLIGEERQRMRRHSDELRRLMRQAALSGAAYFRGNDRSPGAAHADVAKAAASILADAIPTVFDRFEEAAAKPQDAKKGLDALLKADNLQGLPPIFPALDLVRSEQGKVVIDPSKGPLKEVLARIKERASYGEAATGRYLADEFAKEPFGWDFETVRLLTLALLRANLIDVTSKGQTFDTATGPQAHETFSNNNLYRQAALRPAEAIDFPAVVAASEAYKDTFGSEVAELTSSALATQIREAVGASEDAVSSALTTLIGAGLPGTSVLQDALSQMRSIGRGSDNTVIGSFNASHRSIKEAIQRANELEQVLTEQRLADIRRARTVQSQTWPLLAAESDVEESLRATAAELRDVLEREDFFRELATIDQHASVIVAEYDRRHQQALRERVAAYEAALMELATTPGWTELEEAARGSISAVLRAGADPSTTDVPIAQLRADRAACQARLNEAVKRVVEIASAAEVEVVRIAPYFQGGIENEEQLEAALTGLREECERVIGSGKKIVVQ